MNSAGTPERWRQIEDLYHRALERDETERDAFLRQASGTDTALRREVESLLAQTATGHFISVPTVDVPTVDIPTAETPTTSNPSRPTWWMFVLAAAYAVSSFVALYLVIRGPVELRGMSAIFENGAMAIRSVNPESQLAKGGLRAGDRVIAIDDVPMLAVRDWNIATGNLQAERPQHWLVERDHSRITLEIIALRAGDIGQRVAEGYVQYFSHLVTLFLLGLLIAWKRPKDAVGRMGAWFLFTASLAFGWPMGWAVIWRQLPSAVQWLLWIPQLSRFVLEGIFLSFFVMFPRRVVTRWWWWVALWVPVIATTPWRITAFYSVIHPGRFAPTPSWILQVGFARTILYLFVGIVVLTLSYRRLLDSNEKRRVRVLIAGTTASAISAILTVWLDSFSGRNLTGVDVLFTFFIVPFNTACPVSLAYAILRHRVLDIHIIIRQGLQYALARGAVLGIIPALGAALVADLAWNSQQPLAAIMLSRGWIYAGLSGVALIAYFQRKPWLEALDRRFFRERYDAQRVLRGVVDEIRAAKSFERVLPRVVSTIETALHPQFVSVMVRRPDDHSYRSIASIPEDKAPAPFSAESKLAGMVRLLGKPLELLTANSAWLEQRLGRHEAGFVRRARIDLMVPIAVNPGGTEAVLALGARRSEEPYTGDDQELLETIASSLAMLLDEKEPVSATTNTFDECPACGTCYSSRTGTCMSDGITLVPVSLPPVLAGRYELQRRHGRGGMGAVYQAIDRALDRCVAVKVIRDDWVGNMEAAQRFRREARASAAFAHPNVVTVHDFGVEAGARGFLVMEFLEGNTLRNEIAKLKQIGTSRIVEIFSGVCAAIEAAHARQLIHRDLKPENIFLAKTVGERQEVVKILDFGIAKFLDQGDDSNAPTLATNTGVLIGTLPYMSPEQFLGEAPHPLWDLWALAVVAYECLTGALPFSGDSSVARRNEVVSGNFTPLEKYLKSPRPAWTPFFARSFHRNDAKRPQSASEFFQQLTDAFRPS